MTDALTFEIVYTLAIQDTDSRLHASPRAP